MKRLFFAFLLMVLLRSSSSAQGVADPLLLHGFDQRTSYDVRSRGMGGAILASGNNASVLFVNPAALAGLGSIQFRASAMNISTSYDQRQEWIPNRYWTGLSLLMEDKWGDIKTPVSTDPWEQLQKPLDSIGPNWSRNQKRTLPLSLVLSVPVDIGSVPFVLGLGGSRAIDLEHYFQNNNVTDPLLGQYRPQPIPEVQPSDTLRVRWFQFRRVRTGTIWGITPAVAVSVLGVELGASATYYTGKSNEFEERYDRGFLTFLYNRFRIQDTVKFTSSRRGSSTYKGFGGVVGVRIDEPHFALAATVQLPYSLERKFDSDFSSREDVLVSRSLDSVRTTQVNTASSGTDKIRFPFAYSLGLLLKPLPKWSVAFDYDVRRFDKVEYESAGGSVTRPWISGSSFQLGAEYRMNEWLAFRCGYREVPQTFAPAGSAIIGDAAVMSVIAAGVGFDLHGMQIDVAYEYARLRYEDMWQSNVNYNSVIQHRVVFEFGYHGLFE